MPPDNRPKPFTSQMAALEERVEQFEAAWQRQQTPAIEDYLPGDESIRPQVLVELVQIDLEFRLKAGQAVDAAAYLKRFPELSANQAAAVDLIAADYRFRSRTQPTLSTEEYVRRFPQYRDALLKKLGAAQVAAREPSPDDTVAFAAPAQPARPGAVPLDLQSLAPPLLAVIEQVRELQLLTDAQLDELAPLLHAGPEPATLGKELTRRGWLTGYQTEQILQGKGRGLVFGPYLLLEPLGKGGMGQVFKAQHRVMKRTVALKIIRKGHLPHGEAVKRFQQEIESAAKLAHPNIVTAHDAGRVGDYHFFVMEFVEGATLSDLIKQRGPLPVAEACAIVRQAALGLQHAHERGLVHRDIKPQNLIVGGGVVKILDMGLARVRYDPADKGSKALTQLGMVMGTPDYIAPEQIMDARGVDSRADLYSLGCTLYQLLTGQPPFPGKNLARKLDQHLREEPPPMNNLRAELPSALTAIVHKMLAKQPDARYSSAAKVAAALGPYCPGVMPDLRLARDSDPLLAEPTVLQPAPGAIQRLPAVLPASPQTIRTGETSEAPVRAMPVFAPDAGSPLLRNRRLWPWVAAVSALLIVPLAVWLGVWLLAETPKVNPVGPPVNSDAPLPAGPDLPPQGAEFTNSVGMKLVWISPGEFLMGSPESETGRDKNEPVQHKAKISAGYYLGAHEVTQEQYQKVMGVNPSQCNKDKGGGPTHPVEFVTWMDAREFCYRLGNLPNEAKQQRTYRLPTEAEWEYACRAGADTMYSFGDDKKSLGEYAWWKENSDNKPHPVGQLKPNKWGLFDLHGNVNEWFVRPSGVDHHLRGGGFASDWDFLRCASRDLISQSNAPYTNTGFRVVCEIKDTPTPKIEFGPPIKVAWTAKYLDGLDSKDIAAEDRLPWVPKETVAILGDHRCVMAHAIRHLTLSSDEKWLAAGSDGGVVSLIDAETLRIHWETAVTGKVTGLRFVPKSNSLLLIADEKTIDLWDVSAKKKIRQIVDVSSSKGSPVHVTPDGKKALYGSPAAWHLIDIAASGNLDRKDYVLKPGKQAAKTTLEVTRIAISADGKQALLGCNDNNLRLVDLVTGKEVHCLEGHGGAITGLDFFPDGKKAVSTSAVDNTMRIWDVESGTNLHEYTIASPNQAAVLKDGKSIIVTCLGHTWRVNSEEKDLDKAKVWQLEGAVCVVVTADEKFAYTLWGSGIVAILLKSGARINSPIRSNSSPNVSVTFTPDGRKLLVQGGYGEIWNFESGTKTPALHSLSMALAPDGQSTATFLAAPLIHLRTLSQQPLATMLGHWQGNVLQQAFSPDGYMLATGGTPPTVLIWDTASGKQLRRFDVGGCNGLCFTPDGRKLIIGATGGVPGIIQFCDVSDGKIEHSLSPGTGGYVRVAVSTDGKKLAFGNSAGEIGLYDLPKPGKKPAALWDGHTGGVNRVLFAPDGLTLFTCGTEGTVSQWDLTTKKALRTWTFPWPVYAIDLSPDGRYLAIGAYHPTGVIYILRLK